MPKCPKCHQEVDSLHYTESGLLVWDDGERNWVRELEEVEHQCPECGEKVSLDEMEV